MDLKVRGRKAETLSVAFSMDYAAKNTEGPAETFPGFFNFPFQKKLANAGA